MAWRLGSSAIDLRRGTLQRHIHCGANSTAQSTLSTESRDGRSIPFKREKGFKKGAQRHDADKNIVNTEWSTPLLSRCLMGPATHWHTETGLNFRTVGGGISKPEDD